MPDSSPPQVHRLPRRTSPRLIIDLDDALAARIDEAIAVVAGSRAAVEMGVTIDRARVARIAIVRGLDALMGGYEADVGGASPPVAPRAGRPVVKPAPRTDAVLRDDGTLSPPEGWTSQEREKIPAYQADIHDHYISSGWERWLVWVGERDWAYAYWIDRLDAQEGVVPWPSAQVVNLGERGVAHMIPGTYGKE